MRYSSSPFESIRKRCSLPEIIVIAQPLDVAHLLSVHATSQDVGGSLNDGETSRGRSAIMELRRPNTYHTDKHEYLHTSRQSDVVFLLPGPRSIDETVHWRKAPRTLSHPQPKEQTGIPVAPPSNRGSTS